MGGTPQWSSPNYLIWRWDKQKIVHKSPDPKKTLRVWFKLMKDLKAKLLPKSELQPMYQGNAEFARFAIAAMTGQPYQCQGPRLLWQVRYVQTVSGETVRASADWIREGAGDITIDEVDFVSGQYPEDDNDPDAAADVEVTFTIKGRSLAQLLGKQARVLPQTLEKLDSRKALKLLGQGSRNPAIKELFAALQRPVARLVDQEARSQFGRGAKLDPRSLEFTQDESYWSAKVDPKKQAIRYQVEMESYWSWL